MFFIFNQFDLLKTLYCDSAIYFCAVHVCVNPGMIKRGIYLCRG